MLMRQKVIHHRLMESRDDSASDICDVHPDDKLDKDMAKAHLVIIIMVICYILYRYIANMNKELKFCSALFDIWIKLSSERLKAQRYETETRSLAIIFIVIIRCFQTKIHR